MVLSGCVGLTVMWVANFKLLAYTGNRGALAHPDVQASVLVWAALLVLPFFPAKSKLCRKEVESCFQHSMLKFVLQVKGAVGSVEGMIGREGWGMWGGVLCWEGWLCACRSDGQDWQCARLPECCTVANPGWCCQTCHVPQVSRPPAPHPLIHRRPRPGEQQQWRGGSRGAAEAGRVAGSECGAAGATGRAARSAARVLRCVLTHNIPFPNQSRSAERK